jgi:hypothetical protein
MKIAKLLAGVAVATVALAGSAMAAPIDFGGYTGNVVFKYSNYEAFSAAGTVTDSKGDIIPAPAVGSNNFGIFSVTSALANGAGLNILNQTQYNYVGIFTGITTTAVDPFTAGANGYGFSSTTTGGTFQLYQIPVGSINLTAVEMQGLAGYAAAGCAVGGSCYHGITDVGGTLVLQWDVGTNSLNPSYSVTNPNGTVVNNGSTSGNATVTGGTAANQFGSTLSISDDFCFNNGTGTAQCGTGGVFGSNPATNWQLLSQDPVTATILPVPEPMTLSLFGAGIVGAAALRRRRKAKKA